MARGVGDVARTTLLDHFVFHISEMAVYRGEGGYDGRRLVLYSGGLQPQTSGACGYAHAVELYLSPGRRIMSHWHKDREAIFYCLSGHGRFLLDGMARDVGPGDAMFMPTMAVHGVVNTGGDELRFIDVALFTPTPSRRPSGEHCFASVTDAPRTRERGAEVRTLFPTSTFSNPKIEWCGELLVGAGRWWEEHVYPESEAIMLVLEGTGTLILDGHRAALRPGTVLYLPAGHAHAVVADESLRIWGVRSGIGMMDIPGFLAPQP